MSVCKLHNAMDKMQKYVASQSRAGRTPALRIHNALTSLQPFNFTSGNYVMINSTNKKVKNLALIGRDRGVWSRSNAIWYLKWKILQALHVTVCPLIE